MSTKFTIYKNDFLKEDVTGYYHQIYKGFREQGNPDFLNTLKNTFDSDIHKNLIEARNKVVKILLDNIPNVMMKENISRCMLVCVPRAKALRLYSKEQLMLKDAIKIAANNIYNVIDGTDCIERVITTKTTHLRKATTITNNGKEPYPGITIDTCEIDERKIKNQIIILVDDIYTKNVNIDEDCIQALFDSGANKVIFYSIGYTRRV